MRKVRTALAVGFLAASSLARMGICGPVGRAAPSQPDTLEAVVGRAATRALAKPGAVGLSVAVGQHGLVCVAKGYGLREVKSMQAVDASTVFHGCSTSKQFAAAAALRLVERGRISLDDPVTKYLPRFHAHDRPLLVRHLLNHTSGLPTFDELPVFAGENEIRDVPHERIVEMFQDEPCAFAPGEAFAYTNSGYFLIGEILERVSGEAWGDFLRDEFAGPLKLEDTSYAPHPPPDFGARIAVGYTVDHGEIVEARKIAWANASCAGGNLTTARDLVIWSIALSAGKVVSPESYTQMTTPTMWPDGDCSGYGMGLWVDPDRSGAGHDRVWHTGHGDGYTAAVAQYPHDELVIAVMSNSDTVESMEVVSAIAADVLHLKEPLVDDRPLPADRVAEFVGSYENARTHETVIIDEHDGHLTAKPGSRPTFTLLWQGGERFILKEDRRTEVLFERSGAPKDSANRPMRKVIALRGGLRQSAVRGD